MNFFSLPFAAFFVLTLAVFWLLRKNFAARALVLIAASYAFYASFSPPFAVAILLVTLLDYGIGRLLAASDGKAKRRLLLLVSICFNAGLFAAFKYASFYGHEIESFDVAKYLPGSEHLSVAFPVGLIFFVLQSLSHTIDVYRGKQKACESLLTYMVYIAFFPRLMAGPIARAGQLLPQIKEVPKLSVERRGLALFLLLSGIVKKVVFADYLALNLVDKVFDLPYLFSTTEVILAIYAYTVQIYCEFSGFTDICLALGLLVGLELPVNFRFPLQASNLRQFWRRWFISLSDWVRDYIYLPLKGSHEGWRAYPALIVTMLLVGLCMGPASTFLLWGLLQALGLALTRGFHQLLGKSAESSGFSVGRFLGWLLTFHFVVLTWALFRSTDFEIVTGLWDILQEKIWHAPNLTAPVVIVLALGLIGSWIPPKLYEGIRNLFGRLPLALQVGLVVMVLIFVFQVSTADAIPFVYER